MLAALWQRSTVESVSIVSREVPLTKGLTKWRSLRSRRASVRTVKTFGMEHRQSHAQAQAPNADVLGSRIVCGFCISMSSGLLGHTFEARVGVSHSPCLVSPQLDNQDCGWPPSPHITSPTSWASLSPA